jgi:pimeloyl-ACP methyl ester carboxylesterase
MRPGTYAVLAWFLVHVAAASGLAESGGTPTRARIVLPAGGQRISGDLWLPPGAGPFPAVIFIPGGGPGNQPPPGTRSEGFQTLGALAPLLAAKGIAVLLVIPHTDPESTPEDRAREVLAARAYLGQRPEIARGKVGLCGHSLGGIVAAIAAAQSPDVAFVVLVAGPCTSLSETAITVLERVLRNSGADDAEIARMRAVHENVFRALREGKSLEPHRPALLKVFESHYGRLPEEQKKGLGSARDFASGVVDRYLPKTAADRFLLSYDPKSTLGKIHSPVLALFGGNDPKVSLAANREPLLRSLPDGGDHTTMLIPGADHLFQDVASPSRPQLAPGLPDIVAGWIVSRVGQASPRAGPR